MYSHQQKVIDHLVEALGKQFKADNLVFYDWQAILGIKGINYFHKVAQALEQDNLRTGHGDLHFCERIQGDFWIFQLVGDNSKFREKYGKHYKMRKF